MPMVSPMQRRARRGKLNDIAGRMAEDWAAGHYEAGGAAVLARRHRNGAGEIDIVARDGREIVFCEVKRVSRPLDGSPPVSKRQLARLGAAAEAYLLTHRAETGEEPPCRFDVALVGRDGIGHILRNAHSFDTV
ncbi:MAG: YraN family protein [Pseudomonadota bacterium]